MLKRQTPTRDWLLAEVAQLKADRGFLQDTLERERKASEFALKAATHEVQELRDLNATLEDQMAELRACARGLARLLAEELSR